MKKEDIEFLKDLQHELNTQNNEGNAEPVYWSIMERKEMYDPDGDTVYFNIDTADSHYSMEEAAEYINDELEESSDMALREEWEYVDKSDYYELTDFMDKMNIDYEIECYTEEDVISTITGCFLTKRAADEYIKKFGYNHSKPYTYSTCAYRNFELERFLKLFREMNLDDIKINE